MNVSVVIRPTYFSNKPLKLYILAWIQKLLRSSKFVQLFLITNNITNQLVLLISFVTFFSSLLSKQCYDVCFSLSYAEITGLIYLKLCVTLAYIPRNYKGLLPFLSSLNMAAVCMTILSKSLRICIFVIAIMVICYHWV